MDKEDLLDLKGNITFTLVAGGMIYLIYFIYQFLLPSSACFRDAKKQFSSLQESKAKITSVERGMNVNGGSGNINISHQNYFGGRVKRYVICTKGKAQYLSPARF